MDSCFINLTFYNEPIDDIFKEFFSIGQAETQGMPGILDSSFNQKPWDVPFKAYEQENGKDIFSDMSDPNTYLERMEIQKQYEIYNIFLMKYSQGMSEPQITDHIAKNYPSHQNIKVTGVRYVLRCKQPSPGIPNDPKRKQASPAKFRSKYQNCKNNMPMPFDFHEGILSQKRLQELLINRQNSLSTSPQPALYQAQQDPLSCQLALPLSTSFQSSHQKLQDDQDKGTTSLINFENLGALGYAAGDFLNSLPPEVTNETQDILGYYSGAPEIVSKDPSECLPTRKSSAVSFSPFSHLNPPNPSRCDQYSINSTGLLTNAMTPNDNSKGKETLKDLRTSTINLFNPEFHEPFGLPPDTQLWATENTEETNLTLHGRTPTGEVTINFFNPIFHSDCFISEKFVSPDDSFVKM